MDSRPARPNDTKPDSPESSYGDNTDGGGQMQLRVGSPYSPSNYDSPQEPPAGSGTPPPSLTPTGPQVHEITSPQDDDHKASSSPKPPVVVDVGSPWTTGLFDCHLHQTNAVMTAFFPCVAFGQIAEILEEGETSCTLGSFMYILMAPALCTCWSLSSNYRTKLRNKYNLVQAPAEDWTLHLFCPCCSLCQEFRELKNRGMDPSLGWMGYLAQQQEKKNIPPQSQLMTK